MIYVLILVPIALISFFGYVVYADRKLEAFVVDGYDKLSNLDSVTIQNVLLWPDQMRERQWRPFDKKHPITFIAKEIEVFYDTDISEREMSV